MKVYWAVSNRYYNDGAAHIGKPFKVEASEKPQNSFRSTSRYDSYIDYFDTYSEAYEFYNSNIQ